MHTFLIVIIFLRKGLKIFNYLKNEKIYIDINFCPLSHAHQNFLDINEFKKMSVTDARLHHKMRFRSKIFKYTNLSLDVFIAVWFTFYKLSADRCNHHIVKMK